MREKGEFIIASRIVKPPPSAAKEGPRVNEEIVSPQVRLIDLSGGNCGVVPLEQAFTAAAEEGLDLVEMDHTAQIPVVRVMDFGKYKYELQKKRHQARRRQKNIDLKEIKLRPNIDSHDYEVKMRACRRFLTEKDKVKVTLRFRGREMVHQELGTALLAKVVEEVADLSKIESEPQIEGRQMTMVLAPK